MNEKTSQELWESRWKSSIGTNYTAYLECFNKKQDPIIELFKRYNVHHVCDAACGFGAYSLMLASNGFGVEGFDISPTSVEITKSLLQKYGIDTSKYKVASVLEPGYNEQFDAVTAISVLDHMCISEARKALEALLRIVKPSGIVVVSFDSLDNEDLELPHDIMEDGSLRYANGPRNGMVFHFYSTSELESWLSAYAIILSYTNDRGERFFALQKN